MPNGPDHLLIKSSCKTAKDKKTIVERLIDAKENADTITYTHRALKSMSKAKTKQATMQITEIREP